jgi:SnoaL-like domain
MEKQLAALANRVDALEREVKTLRDHEEIRDVLTRYSRALDWLNAEMLDGVFFADAEIDYGFFRGRYPEFRPIVMQIEIDAGRRWHFTAQIKIQLQGDVAHVDSYNLSLSSPKSVAAPGGELSTFIGYYSDRLERRNGRWGIAARKHLLLSACSWPETPTDGPLAALNLIGYPDMKNPHYRALGD